MIARVDRTFQALAAKHEAAFMPFLVLGDPTLDHSRELTRALVRGGADFLEFGLAFSDPPADGPVIQAAGRRALSAGVNTDHAFDFLAGVRSECETPIALLLYFNLVLQRGVRAFYRRAKECGVDAVLVADLPLEECAAATEAALEHDIAPIFIASELTSDARLEKIAQLARGYIYLVARLGVTGQREAVSPSIEGIVARIRRHTALPVLAGFGLSTPAHVRAVIEAGADGAISGSAVVARVERHLGDPAKLTGELERFTREMKEATRDRRVKGA